MSEYGPGKKIFKEYRYKDFLGEGGYGRVYLVENEVGQLFALKVLHKDVHLEERGVRDVLKIRSVRLVHVMDYGKTQAGDFCVVMEYVKENLEDLLRDGKLDEDRACRFFIEILKGLEDLEQNAIVHRDIKPANLFLLNDVVKIGDFGSARYTSGASSKMSNAPYTDHYSSPERFSEKYGHSVDRWAAAVVFCRMLSGRHPFDGKDRTVIFGSIMKGVPDLNGVSGRYHAFIKRSFDKEVESRYENAREMRRDFELIVREERGLIFGMAPRIETSSSLYPSPKCSNTIAGAGIWHEPKTGMELVWVPGGTYTMGSPDNEEGRLEDEGPLREVTVSGFWLGRYPVTQGEWQSVMGENPSHFKLGNTHPVERVSWNDAREFIKKLNEMNDGKYGLRLPTEAEWEYACRAGTSSPFHFGETISTDQANYNGNHVYGNGRKGVYPEQTTPVGRFPANAFGFYDMHGNVWEWCEDEYSEDAYRRSGRPTTSTYTGDGSRSRRVLRGGSWFNAPRDLRCAYRHDAGPERRFNGIGFRLVRAD